MLSFECIKNEKSVYFLLTSAFKRELGSIRHYGHENAQKQANCERCLSGIGQLKRGE